MKTSVRIIAFGAILGLMLGFASSQAISASAAKPYWACLKSGVLSKVGTTKPTCTKPAVAIQLSIPGPQGLRGPTGPQGLQGIQGEVGPQGLQGIQGATGPQGLQGIQGATGPQGLQGIQGATGPQGQSGKLYAKTGQNTFEVVDFYNRIVVLEDGVLAQLSSNGGVSSPWGEINEWGNRNMVADLFFESWNCSGTPLLQDLSFTMPSGKIMTANDPWHGPNPIYSLAGIDYQFNALPKSAKSIRSHLRVQTDWLGFNPPCDEIVWEAQPQVFWAVDRYELESVGPLSEPVG